MSFIDAKAFNEMLRKDKLDFATNEKPVLTNMRLVYKGERLKAGIEYALTHFEEIAELECKNIFNRQKGITIAHLKAAKSFIAMYQEGDEKGKALTEEKEEDRKSKEEIIKAYEKSQRERLKIYKINNQGKKLNENVDECPDLDSDEEIKFEFDSKESQKSSSIALRFYWFDRISEFLIKCHLLARTIPEEFTLLIDESRKEQMYTMFGAPVCELDEKYLPIDNFQPINFDKNSYCTQIIFDSADLQSAMDTLFERCWHSLDSPWDINVVFIQESLRKEVIRRINTNRMDDNGKLMFEEVKTKLGGEVFQNADSKIEFVLDVLPKYIDMEKNVNTICINFFRTATEVNALMKEYPCKLFSIWTEKIGLFYEMVSKLNGSIIWSNSVGLIDENTVRTLYGFDDIRQSGHSMINTDERYAIHRLHNDNGSSKYLVIPFGVSFAN